MAQPGELLPHERNGLLQGAVGRAQPEGRSARSSRPHPSRVPAGLPWCVAAVGMGKIPSIAFGGEMVLAGKRTYRFGRRSEPECIEIFVLGGDRG
jgi:hypothetical protein